MNTKKLTLEISESLYQQLAELAELTEESIETVAIQILASRIGHRIERERSLNEMLDKITPDQLHDEIDFGEPVGREIW
jgi:antitoxin MazE